jgi:molybdopterin synthase catalytic subunit
VIFVGTARDGTDGRKVLRLEFEAYKKMALFELNKIAEQACQKWPIHSVVIQHRVGTVLAGETAVIIVVAAERRDAAFKACRYTIDTLKTTVPIWKKEVFEGGAEWVTPHP